MLELFELLVEPELELLSAGLSWVLPLLAESACTLRSPASVPPNSFTLTLRCDSMKLRPRHALKVFGGIVPDGFLRRAQAFRQRGVVAVLVGGQKRGQHALEHATL